MGPSAKFSEPILQVANKETYVKPMEQSPLTLSPGVKIALQILMVLAIAIAGLPAAGVALPPIVVTIAALVAAVCGALGIKGADTAKKPEEPK